MSEKPLSHEEMTDFEMFVSVYFKFDEMLTLVLESEIARMTPPGGSVADGEDRLFGLLEKIANDDAALQQFLDTCDYYSSRNVDIRGEMTLLGMLRQYWDVHKPLG